MAKRKGVFGQVMGMFDKTDEQLQPGSRFNDFSAETQDQRPLDTQEHRGQWLVIWFYPRAGTTV